VYLSADKVIQDDLSAVNNNLAIGTEYLNSLHPQGIATPSLEVKIRSSIILLCNLNAKEGLCNGSWMIVTRMGDKVLEARLITGDNAGLHVFIPWIALDSAQNSGHPFTLRQLKFSVRLSFGMTVNKS